MRVGKTKMWSNGNIKRGIVIRNFNKDQKKGLTKTETRINKNGQKKYMKANVSV